MVGVHIRSFDPGTGNPSLITSDAAPAEQGAYVQRTLDHVTHISWTLELTPEQAAEFVADPHPQQTSSGATAVHLQQYYNRHPDLSGRARGAVLTVLP